MKIKGMQKLAVILLVLLVSACHKEFVSTTNQQQTLMVRNSVIETLPLAEIEMLNWDKMEVIESDGQLLGYKIPFNYNTAVSYSFLLANVSNNEVGTLYKNEIKYAPIHGGMYPIAISNYNYSTKETAEYDTQKPVEQTTVKLGMNRPMSLMSVGLHLPAVTSFGVFDELANQTQKLSEFHSYILGYLLGFGEMSAHSSKTKQSPTLSYYDPLLSHQQQKDRKAVIEWDIQR